MAALGQIGLGTWPLGGNAYGPVSSKQSKAVLRLAGEMHVPWIDTADVYGDGTVETMIGEVLGGAQEPRIVTKFGYVTENGRAQNFLPHTFASRLTASLSRLRRDYANVVLLHSPSEETLADATVRNALADLRHQGLARAIGVSLAHVDHYPLLADWDDLQSVELIYNLLDQRAAEYGYLDDARRRRRQVIARLPLCSGFLTRRDPRTSDFLPGDTRRRWPQSQISAWDRAARGFEFLVREPRSMAQAAIAFCIASPGVSLVIPGAKSTEQLLKNMVAADDSMALNDYEFERARALWPSIANVIPR